MQLDPSPNTGLVTIAVAPTEMELASEQGRSGTSGTMADTGSGSTTDATRKTDATPVSGTPGRSATTAPASPSRAAAVAPASTSNAAAAAGSTDAPAPSRVRSRRPQLQPQIASAQQARDFLELTAAQLQSLKAMLSARLAGLRSQDAQLQTQLQAVTSTWRSRPDATAGSVDAQLRFSATATALQRFSVRGLDLRSLRDGSSETLAISFAGADVAAVAARSVPVGGDRANASIDIDPRLSDEALVNRFHRALSPLGLGVDVDASGALIFGVVEAAWPAVRDSLAIKGNGIRFPAGQPTRARTDAEPAVMQPQEWTARDATALRHALAEVTRALDRVQQARAAVERALADASRQVDAAPANDGAAAQAMAEAFVSVAGRPGYQALSSVSAALVGTSRSRVATLLALPDAV